MDIESSFRQILEKTHTLENFHEEPNGFSFTIKNSEQRQFKIKTMQFSSKIDEVTEKLEFRFKNLKNLDDFFNAFNLNIFDTLYEDINFVKNEFNFLNSYLFGKELEFEDLNKFLHCGLLRSERIHYDFFALSFKIHFYPQTLKFLLHYSYSYFDNNSGGIFEDNLFNFRLSFLKRYVVPILDKPLDQLSLDDYKVLHMYNI